MAFAAGEPGMRHWFDGDPQGAPPADACVAYVDTARAWVAACGPLAGSDEARARAALRFVAAARASGRRACFFATEDPALPGLSRLLIGEQPIFRPGAWLAELSRHRRLREQLRRARAKGLTVRRVAPGELTAGAPLRASVERLAAAWLGARRLEPMKFLLALEPFHAPEQHLYLLAERGGRAVGFLSAVPIGARHAWLVEDVVRSGRAPNGTTESLLAALMRETCDSAYVTLGLTPLAGAVAWPLRMARWIARPLFDFEGLRAFRERLRPHAWQPVWLSYPRGRPAGWAIHDSLRAFAGGSLVGFGVRSLVRHPSGLPWALALPLPAWTAGLAWLLASHRAALLGLPRIELGLWIAFDALLLLVLVRVAMRPRRARLLLATALASVDAALSLGHLAWVGPGATALQVSLRSLSMLAPVAGALLLAWATSRSDRAAR